MKPAFYLLLLSLPGLAANQTWTGQITENMCGADHSAMSSGGQKVDSHDCTLTCVKGGAKFAFLASNERCLLDALLQVLPGGEAATSITKKRKRRDP